MNRSSKSIRNPELIKECLEHLEKKDVDLMNNEQMENFIREQRLIQRKKVIEQLAIKTNNNDDYTNNYNHNHEQQQHYNQPSPLSMDGLLNEVFTSPGNSPTNTNSNDNNDNNDNNNNHTRGYDSDNDNGNGSGNNNPNPSPLSFQPTTPRRRRDDGVSSYLNAGDARQDNKYVDNNINSHNNNNNTSSNGSTKDRSRSLAPPSKRNDYTDRHTGDYTDRKESSTRSREPAGQPTREQKKNMYQIIEEIDKNFNGCNARVGEIIHQIKSILSPSNQKVILNCFSQEEQVLINTALKHLYQDLYKILLECLQQRSVLIRDIFKGTYSKKFAESIENRQELISNLLARLKEAL